jgi:hypothetical protein
MALYLGRAPAVTDNDFNVPVPLEAENITDPGGLHGFEHALIALGEICTRILRLLYGLKGVPEKAHRESAEIKDDNSWSLCQARKTPSASPVGGGIQSQSGDTSGDVSQPHLNAQV